MYFREKPFFKLAHFRLFPAWAALAPTLITSAVTANTAGSAARALQGEKEAAE